MADPLDCILKPRSIAVIGASRQPNTIGHQVVWNLVQHGFTGPVYPVNPSANAICSIPAYASVADLREAVDLAVICVPKQHVLRVARECAGSGVKGLVVISAGFREVGGDGIALERELLDVVRGAGMRMVGPNCMGVLNTDPLISMNATFAPGMPGAGGFAFMSQSGALGLSVIDYAQEYGIGISQFVSVGNKPDVSGNDLLVQWEHDPAVNVILMYVENFGNPRKFLEIAARVTKRKPIIALKSGRSLVGATAAASHTGALAASDLAVDALLAQAGVLRAASMEELFDMAIAFGSGSPPRSRRTAVLTNAGGPGILAADALAAHDLELPELTEATSKTLSALLPAEASLRNPLDMIASARPSVYRGALEALLADANVDAVMAIFVPPMGVRQDEVAEAIGAAAATRKDKTVVAVMMGRHGLPEGRNELHSAGIPAFIFPESAARGLAALNRQREWQNRVELPAPEIQVDRNAAAALISAASGNNAGQLDQGAALELLRAYGIAVARPLVAPNADQAVAAAAQLGYPVALKLLSADIVHKTEVGGVRLNLLDAAGVRAAFSAIVEGARAAFPDARIDGVIAQRMHRTGIELIVGGSRDPVFGALVMFGIGGTLVEAVRDVAFRVAPLSANDALDLTRAIRAQKLLQGFRGEPAVDRDALIDTILRVSRLLSDFPQITELDINPLVASDRGMLALDARVTIQA